MKQPLPLFALVALHLTETVSLCNLYLFFMCTADKGYGYMELWPWMLLSLATFFILHFYLRPGRSLGAFAPVCLACFAITALVMSLWFIHVEGILAWIGAWFFLAITTLRACLLNLDGSDTNGVLLHCELPALGIVLLLWLSEGQVFYFPPYYMVCTLLCLGLCLLALTLTRMNTAGGAGDGNQATALGTTALCLGVMTLITGLVAHLTQGYISATVSRGKDLALRLITTLGTGLQAFFLWLISLFPAGEEAPLELIPEETQEIADVATTGEINSALLLLLAGLCVGLILLALCWVLFRLRRLRLRRLSPNATYRRPAHQEKRGGFWTGILAFFRQKWGQFRFTLRVLLKRNTPQGCGILLAQIGEKRGVLRGVGESYPHYLRRLAPLCDPQAGQNLAQLAQVLEHHLYAPQIPTTPLPHQAYAQMRRAVRQLEKVKASPSMV